MSSPERTGDLRNTQRRKELSIDLWEAIAKRLTAISDYISFRCVCRSWRSASTFDNFDREFPRVPGLMYTRKWMGGAMNPRDNFTTITYFLDLESRNIRILNFPPLDGIPYLSWNEWILYVPEDSADICLRHFLRQSQKFVLPGLDTFPAYQRRQDSYIGLTRILFINKIVLSERPTIENDFVVMAIWGAKRQLAFCRRQDSSWTVTYSWNDSFCDIVYHNRKLYALDESWRVVECDVHGPNPLKLRQVFILRPFDNIIQVGNFYNLTHLVVASSGKFLIVLRYFTGSEASVGFRIFEFDLMDGSYGEIHHLGNKALFLGFNSSICLDLSASTNVEPNCIYFTDPLGKIGNSITGAYNLSTRSFELLLERSITDIHLPPIWVMPSF